MNGRAGYLLAPDVITLEGPVQGEVSGAG